MTLNVSFSFFLFFFYEKVSPKKAEVYLGGGFRGSSHPPPPFSFTILAHSFPFLTQLQSPESRWCVDGRGIGSKKGLSARGYVNGGRVCPSPSPFEIYYTPSEGGWQAGPCSWERKKLVCSRCEHARAPARASARGGVSQPSLDHRELACTRN